MAKETAKKCLLYIGGGGTALTAASTISLSVSGSTITLTDSASGFDSLAEGDIVTVAGFTTNGDFEAVVKTAASGSLVLLDPLDPDTRESKTLSTEAAGSSITVTYEAFSLLKGQKSTTYDKSASEIDTTDKTSDNWGSSLAGSVKMTIKASGQIVFTTDGKHGGYTAIRTAIDDGDSINVRLKTNSLGDCYYGPVVCTADSGGGGTDDVSGFDFTFSLAAKPHFVQGVV